MSKRPKSFDDAIDALENFAPGTKTQFKAEIDRVGELFGEIFGEEKAKVKAERHIQHRPWLTMGLVGLVFLALGYLLGRKGRR